MSIKKAAAAVMTALVLGGLCSCAGTGDEKIKYEYGVFLGAEKKDAEKMEPYKVIVLDAQTFSKKQIEKLKKSGHTVYSYINVGAIEDFRPYYDDYVDITLGDYENWDEERWVDVSEDRWQSFILEELAPSIKEKGVDGFFVDNCDVYYHYPEEKIFEGVASILKGLKADGSYVSINGGDAFVTEYADRYSTLDGVMDAVNQETVFSRINWDTDTFSENPESESEYFREYVERVADLGKDVYLLEYTTDKELIKDISAYCKKHGFRYYAADKLELLIPKSAAGSQKKQ